MRFARGVRIWAATAAIGIAAVAPAHAEVAPMLASDGIWRNHKDSVHIQLKPCGTEVCGVVIWASAKADAAVRKKSGKPLVGQQLLRDFVIGPDHIGRGKVYVPDLDATFSGQAQQVDPRTLQARGCLFANIICKAQVWTRIDNLPS